MEPENIPESLIQPRVSNSMRLADFEKQSNYTHWSFFTCKNYFIITFCQNTANLYNNILNRKNRSRTKMD